MTQIGQELDYIARMQSSLYTKKRQNRQKNVALEPYNTPPEGNAPFNYFNGTPGVGQTGNTVIPSSFRVPNGWDGIIDAIVTRYTGTNFTEASGDLTWAIRVDGAYVMGYENIRVSLGDLSGGWKIRPGIIIKSGQLVEMVTIVSGTFVPQTNSVILGAMAGYFYPNGIARTN